MTIDEAIKHELDMAERHEHCESVEAPTSLIDLHKRYAEEHRQVAEWLKDYRRLLNAIEDIKLDIQEYREQCDNETWSYCTESKKEAYTDVLVLIDKHTSGKQENKNGK